MQKYELELKRPNFFGKKCTKRQMRARNLKYFIYLCSMI